MKEITAQADGKQGASVHVTFTADDGTTYDRWVSSDDWKADPEAIVAEVFAYLANKEVMPPITAVKDEQLVVMDADAVADKLLSLRATSGDDAEPLPSPAIISKL